MVGAVTRRLSIFEYIGRVEVRLFRESLIPQELELTVTLNNLAIEKLKRLREALKKVRELGFSTETRIQLTEVPRNIIQVKPYLEHDKVTVSVWIPRNTKLLKILKELESKEAHEIPEILVKVAIGEKEKAQAFLEKLEEHKLIVTIEEVGKTS